jgi:hypothetical protein
MSSSPLPATTGKETDADTVEEFGDEGRGLSENICKLQNSKSEESGGQWLEHTVQPKDQQMS